ncbi:mediator of RNA polymerase II transcription subunit 13-like isoform X2 [Littorina saxatilis]|uniref:Mediator of RNA polymerase II transcription subunit 13 n=1 Tax=Littorina saxatilis TaxID=31220 RepID=A0AAN9AJG7_9CAEN
MSHPNPTGNGCTLEDCYTNLFVLTDICGIKWRRLIVDNAAFDQLDDPVLIAYTKCIQKDILCVWRRVLRNSEQQLNPSDQLSYNKELWVFWYGDPPSFLNDVLCDPSLKEVEHGTWDRDKDSGLTYECRTLLFKALHNLIERCLLSKNFVRLGKWFVMPQDHSTGDRSCHLSFCFHFFLHGESQVCASIEVKQHSPVWRLTHHHLNLLQDTQIHFQVILAPYGLNGTLTGQTYRDTDPHNRFLFQQWNQYYPFDPDETKDYDPNRLPNLVEVLVGGVRMRYPSAYVLICETDETASRVQSVAGAPDTLGGRAHPSSLHPPGHLTPPHSPNPHLQGAVGGGEGGGKMGVGFGEGRMSTLPSIAEVLGHQITERVAQDSTLTTGSHAAPRRSQEGGAEENPNSGAWNFADPSTKVNCNCVKHRKMKAAAQAKSKSSGKKDKDSEKEKGEKGDKEKGDKEEKKTERLERQQSRHGRSSVPFHRRQAAMDDMLQDDMERIMNHLPPNPAFCPTGSTTIPPQGGSTPVPEGPMDTPNSAPSPLDPPPNLPSMEPTMPTLSPHPPSKFLGGGGGGGTAVNGAAAGGGGQAATSAATATANNNNSSNVVNNSGVSGGNATAAATNNSAGDKDATGRNNNSGGGGGLANGTVDQPGGGTDPANPLPNGSLNSEFFPKSDELTCGQGAATPQPPKAATGAGVVGGAGGGAPVPPDAQLPWGESSKKELVSNWLQSQHKCVESVLKRPSLPTNGSDEEEELVTRSLYDHDIVQKWVHFPLKKSRFEILPEMAQPVAGTSGLEPISPPLEHSQRNMLPRSPSPDPYEFSDEASVNPATMTARTRPNRDRQSPRLGDEAGEYGQEDMANDIGQVDSPLHSSGNLMREKDLQVSGAHKDLAQLFESDSSADDDNDGGHMDICYPNSKTLEELKSVGIKLPNDPSETPVIAVSELTRMYPTPPSLETCTKHSPQDTAAEQPMDITVLLDGHIQTVVKTELLHPPAKVKPVSHEDHSKFDVFVPLKQATYVSAPKYSQLPRSQLSSPPAGAIPEYKPQPHWPFGLPMMDAMHPPRTNYVNLPSVEGMSSRPMPSPAFAQQQRTPRTPMSYELQSPASTPSSYLNKTLNSIDNTGTGSPLPEVNSLLVNVLLSDSILNLYRDYNFDSCNVCVCNMDIRGSDMGLYLPDTGSSSESSYKCTCGFSAVINRRFAYNNGLFYEDEVDVTGIKHDRYEQRKPPLHMLPEGKGGGAEIEDIPSDVLHLLMGQFAVAFPSSVAAGQLAALNMAASMSFNNSALDQMGLRDGNEAVYTTLDVARQAQDNHYTHKMDDHSMRMTCLHKWPFIKGAHRLAHNSQDIVQCLKSLQPLLQDAIQYKPITRLWEHTYKLQGPLSWKDFHQLSGRGSVESSEPQPIPHLLVTHDRDWLSVSPYSIRFWDKQYLEPFSRPRDIIYVVVAPDNEFLLQHVRSFFRELSTVYELCRLGRHVPFKPLRDGIMRIGKNTAQKLTQDSVDDWFSLLGDNPIAPKLKLYAQVLKQLLGPLLGQHNLDRSAFDTGSGASHKAQFKTPEPATPSHPATPESNQSPAPGGTTPNSSSTTPNSGQANNDENKGDGSQGEGAGQKENATEQEIPEDSTMPAVVVYLVDPFLFGQEWSDLHRLAMVGLLRSYQQMVLPPHLQNNTFLQVVPMKTILDHQESSAQHQALKSLAFSVFTSCRWNLAHTITARSLTGFGPAAGAEIFLKSKPAEPGNPMRLYSPPYTLAPLKNQQTQLAECCGEAAEKANILFVTYCLSHDQRFLLAVCTDNRGEMLDTCIINIHIPNRNLRKKASARKHGLAKLWDYILGIISMSTRPARIVIGRLGRMGHGELKGWSGLLGKRNLQHASRRVKETCGQCSLAQEAPCVRSACVVSMEMNPSFQVMADTVKQEEKQSSNCPLQTPRDASVTHILVFPTSATAQVNANPMQPGDPNNPMDNYDPLDMFPDDVFQMSDVQGELGGMGQGMEGMDFMDILDSDHLLDNQPGSPNANQDRARQSSRTNEQSSIPNGQIANDPQDDNNLLQQPLAMGYFLSTAPTGPLPHWFWSSCPENQHTSPVCFKAALHVNMSSRQWQDDLDHSSASPSNSNHPLDSHLTCDVLRFVLANYNSLSWLTYDPATNDRRSCLPVHKAVLMQMYHAMQAYL